MIRQDKTLQLSERLQALADMVPGGCSLADVGCDHAFLEIYLVQCGKISHAVAMDVRKGPLEAADRHIREAGLEDWIETRLSDGLEEFQAGEAQVLVCAGMGGPLMQRILTDYPEKTRSFREMILQPQSELREFRRFLRENGYLIQEESILLEDGKYYFPMKVCRGNVGETEADCREIYDRFGKHPIQRKDPLLCRYLLEQKKTLERIIGRLKSADEGKERRRQRLMEVLVELKVVEQAIAMMKG